MSVVTCMHGVTMIPLWLALCQFHCVGAASAKQISNCNRLELRSNQGYTNHGATQLT
jgi:hypothetical protein